MRVATDICVRLSRREDLAAIDALLGRAYPRLLKASYPPSVMVTALPLISRAQPRLVVSGSYFVAETGAGAIVGAGGWTPRAGVPVGDVRHLVSDAARTRVGIGRAILEAAMAQAAEAGIGLLECYSTRMAVPFYRAMGFEELGPLDIALRPGIRFPAIQMRRKLG